MTDRATQATQPKKGKPVEIPVPTRREFFGNLAKVAPPAEAPAALTPPPFEDGST